MAIGQKTRKHLWAKSGNRCAFCLCELFQEVVPNIHSNIGEECHIISSKEDGPRHKHLINGYDGFDNLILLCSIHHKWIDDLPETFTEEVVRFLKTQHEIKVKDSIKDENEKSEKPQFISIITSGKELLNIISDTYGSRMSYDEITSEEQAEFLGDILAEIFDYGEEVDLLTTIDIKMRIELRLNQILKELNEHGYYLYGKKIVGKIKVMEQIHENCIFSQIIVSKRPEIRYYLVDNE